MDADDAAARLALFEEVVRVQASDLDIRRNNERNAMRANHPWKVGLPSTILTGVLAYLAMNYFAPGKDANVFFLLAIASVLGWSILYFLVRLALVLTLPWARREEMFTKRGEDALVRLRMNDFDMAKRSAVMAVEHQYDCPPEWLSEDERERARQRIEAINRLDLARELFSDHQNG